MKNLNETIKFKLKGYNVTLIHNGTKKFKRWNKANRIKLTMKISDDLTCGITNDTIFFNNFESSIEWTAIYTEKTNQVNNQITETYLSK